MNESCLDATLADATLSGNSMSGRQQTIKKIPAWIGALAIGSVLAAGYVVLAPRYSWLPNTGLPDLRNNAIRDKLHSCESFGVVNADVYYDGALSSRVIVFDLQNGGTGQARRIDPVHLFLQFAGKIDIDSLDRVCFARSGKIKYYIPANTLRPLADSYAAGGRVWSFNNLPQSVRTPEGQPAYSEWTGGWLGVLQKQTEDLNDFIHDWTET